MLSEPAELRIDDQGSAELPLGILAEAGIAPGTDVMAFSDGVGRIVIRRLADAVNDLVEWGTL
jgi:bifunctional DNA-binding transcriptional regulator/antitoxin component of YhaV-PrlF toxin-antitoxin module